MGRDTSEFATSLGENIDVVIQLSCLSSQVMKDENIECIDIYSLLVGKLELAIGDTAQWQGPAYNIISVEIA